MATVLIKTDSHFFVDRSRINKVIETCLSEKKFKRKVEISINIVGDRKMREMNRKFRNIDETTDVLSFPMQEEKRTDAPFVDPPDEILRLGDILISYPQVVEDASVENKLVDEKIDELIRHSMDHLLGIHHE